MERNTLLCGLFSATLVLTGLHAGAQQTNRGFASRGSAQGELTVMATVVSSVGLTLGPNGEQRITLANAADARDNVSHFQSVAFERLTPKEASRKTRPHRPNKKSRFTQSLIGPGRP
jgi:hypothetical protein